jgi:hypothetical protein
MISPNDTFTIYLDEDLPEQARKPESERPALVYRYGTAAELADHEHRVEAARHLTGRAYIDAIESCAHDQLMAIRNVLTPIGERATKLAQALTLGELGNLARSLAVRAELSESDRKKSASQSHSPAAAAVASASPEQASA